MPTVVAATDAGLRVGEETRFPGRDVRAVTLDERGDVWAIVDDDLWHEDRRIAGVGAGCRCLSVGDGVALVGTSDARVLRVVHGSVAAARGFEVLRDASDWHAVGSPVHVRSMAHGTDTVYVSVHVGGIVRTDPAGEEWTATGFDVADDVHQVAVSGPAELFAATALGLAHSTDGGDSWAFEWEGLPTCYSRAVAVDRSTGAVAMSVSDGPWASKGTVWMRDPDAGFLSVGDQVEGNIDTGHLGFGGGAVAFAHEDHLWFEGTWSHLPGRVNAVLVRD